jgi:hypothetical protein
MATAKKKPTELDFDLTATREVKRLLNRAVKKLAAIEKTIKRRREDQREAWREKKRVKRETAVAVKRDGVDDLHDLLSYPK